MSDDIALIVIDLQEEYFNEDRPWYVPNSPHVLKKSKQMLDAARNSDATIVHVRHVQPSRESPVFAWGSEYTKIIDEIEVRDNEYLITKTNPGCFQNTELDDILTRNGIETVVCCGLLSFVCVDTTAREAAARSYRPLYVKDATAAFPVDGYDPEKLTETVATIQDLIFSEVVKTDKAIEELKT